VALKNVGIVVSVPEVVVSVPEVERFFIVAFIILPKRDLSAKPLIV
jgi:hypothetical protein